jgi:hypothetical protein
VVGRAPVEHRLPAHAALDRRRRTHGVNEETSTAAGEPAMRVATIPFSDPYVDAVLPSGTVRVGPGTLPSPWLDGEYLAAHAGEVDVVHLHSGFGHLSPVQLECWAETVRRLGIPLVVTVHRLREPTAPDRARHDAHLAALLADAEVVLTLTPGAADVITDRFGRTPIVVAHPSIAVPVPGLGDERGQVGLVLGSASCALPDPERLVRAALSGAVSGGGRLRVLVEPGASPPAVRELAAEDELELLEVCRGGEGWAAELQQLHVAVLAERCGGHSRDLEICRDVGTRVVVPSCGWFTEQWSDVVTYGDDEDGELDDVSLTAAVAAALTRPSPRPADRAWREEQRAAVQRVHAQVYAQVAGDRVLSSSGAPVEQQ